MSLRKLLASSSPQLSRLLRPSPKRTVIAASRPPIILPADVRIEEELIPDYNPRGFYPVNPGDILKDRYRIVAKLGWGTTSTVWLAVDTRPYVLARPDAFSPLTFSTDHGCNGGIPRDT